MQKKRRKLASFCLCYPIALWVFPSPGRAPGWKEFPVQHFEEPCDRCFSFTSPRPTKLSCLEPARINKGKQGLLLDTAGVIVLFTETSSGETHPVSSLWEANSQHRDPWTPGTFCQLSPHRSLR